MTTKASNDTVTNMDDQWFVKTCAQRKVYESIQ